MPIKVACTCGQTFKAKDELAGKRVRCPKCSQPLIIPAPELDDLKLEAPVERPKYNPLDDLLAEEGVKSAPTGPVCPSCSEPVSPTAVLCVQCGFNLQTGEKIHAEDDEDDDELVMAGMSETEKMLYKAEKELEDTPISADGEKFGDEGDSYIVAIVLLVVVVGLAFFAVYFVMFLDSFEDFNTPLVSGWASVFFCVGSMIVVTITAFKERPLEGYLCLGIPGIYHLFYAATRGLYIHLGIMILFGAIAAGCFSYLNSA